MDKELNSNLNEDNKIILDKYINEVEQIIGYPRSNFEDVMAHVVDEKLAIDYVRNIKELFDALSLEDRDILRSEVGINVLFGQYPCANYNEHTYFESERKYCSVYILKFLVDTNTTIKEYVSVMPLESLQKISNIFIDIADNFETNLFVSNSMKFVNSPIEKLPFFEALEKLANIDLCIIRDLLPLFRVADKFNFLDFHFIAEIAENFNELFEKYDNDFNKTISCISLVLFEMYLSKELNKRYFCNGFSHQNLTPRFVEINVKNLFSRVE